MSDNEPDVTDPAFDKESRLYRGTNTLLIGAPGAGKTHALTTFIKAGLDLHVLVTDPGGEETLYEAVEEEGLDKSKLFTRYIPATSSSWNALLEMAEKVNGMSYKALTELKHGVGKGDYTRFLDLLDNCVDFIDDNGVKHGDVTEWGPSKVLALDSASGLNAMAMALIIGAKPAAHQGEWGVAMRTEEELVYKLCADTSCFFVLTAHVDRVMDEVRGSPILTAGFLGNKLAPKIPRIFSDVIYAYKEGNRYFWSTVEPNVDLKARTLPLTDKLDPDFGAIVEVWKRRNEHMKLTQTSTKEKEKK